MSTFANTEDPDEIQYIAAFHQGLPLFVKVKRSSDKRIQYFLKIIT